MTAFGEMERAWAAVPTAMAVLPAELLAAPIAIAAVPPKMAAAMARITAVPRSLDRFISLPLALALFVVRCRS
jgi:hypothetical protein